jgi:DNA-binding LacI/PurR family transcriptional regulator
LSDTVAARVQAYAIRNSLLFPRDISVVGIGNLDIARQLPFPLTTMSESLAETGQILVRLLMKESLGVEPDEFNVYHTHAVLIERQSVCNIK